MEAQLKTLRWGAYFAIAAALIYIGATAAGKNPAYVRLGPQPPV